MTTIINKKGISAVVHVTANATINVAGNSTNSDIALTGETIVGATISQVWYGSANTWTIYRGSNVALVLSGTGHLDFVAQGISLNLDPTATVVVNCNSSVPGFFMVELQKTPQVITY